MLSHGQSTPTCPFSYLAWDQRQLLSPQDIKEWEESQEGCCIPRPQRCLWCIPRDQNQRMPSADRQQPTSPCSLLGSCHLTVNGALHLPGGLGAGTGLSNTTPLSLFIHDISPTKSSPSFPHIQEQINSCLPPQHPLSLTSSWPASLPTLHSLPHHATGAGSHSPTGAGSSGHPGSVHPRPLAWP